jgi:hypothetical protein
MMAIRMCFWGQREKLVTRDVHKREKSSGGSGVVKVEEESLPGVA